MTTKKNQKILRQLGELDEINKMKELFNSYSVVSLQNDFVSTIKKMIQSDQYDLMS